MARLPSIEIRVEGGSNDGAWRDAIAQCAASTDAGLLLPTLVPQYVKFDRKLGPLPGVQVSVAPDDTGRDDSTLGTLVALSPEEVVI